MASRQGSTAVEQVEGEGIYEKAHLLDKIENTAILESVDDVGLTSEERLLVDINEAELAAGENGKIAEVADEARAIEEVGEAAVEQPNGIGSKLNKTSYGKSSSKYKNTLDYLKEIKYKNGNYYPNKSIIDEIGQMEAKGEDFSILNKKIMHSRASTEGGTSIVYRYSDEYGTKYMIHEVTDANGYIIHRDFDAVRIPSGQLINKGK